MTYYESEVTRIRKKVYSNPYHLNTVVEMRNYIDRHYDTSLSLDQLSEVNCVSKYHLLRLFKRYYGQTPMQYLTDKRIEKSKDYLRQGKSITETCFAVGFESPCSFSTLFRSKTGLAPLEFRKRAIFARSDSF